MTFIHRDVLVQEMSALYDVGDSTLIPELNSIRKLSKVGVDILLVFIKDKETSQGPMLKGADWGANDTVSNLIECLNQISALAGDARERLLAVPMQKLASGRDVTLHEYRLLQASRVIGCPAVALNAAQFDDYYVFQMLRYENADTRAYIDIDSPPPESEIRRVGLKVGTVPEHLDISGLRPEQRQFFEHYSPAVLKRFRQD
jgi:hypothetical protein